ncbi:MAG: NYN domain-containing protein [Actinobacteria bacterium]|nr:NYN domain-containing protein [Actinomycetota bacterium]
MEADHLTYLLIDGENLDATLGGSILGRRPHPEERPRWERVVDFLGARWHTEIRPLFFMNASNGTLPMPFVQALMAMGYRPIPLSGGSGVKVVDEGILRMLEAIEGRAGDVVLGSHDGDFAAHIERLIDAGRRVGLAGFHECISTSYRDLVPRGLELFDLEHDMGCFNKPLPRLRVIPLDEFDPNEFL